MSDKIILVTPPDDILIDGVRVLLVNLTPDQSQIISTSLLRLENLTYPLIVYTWKSSEDYNWLLDKKHKSNLIIFNADDISTELIIGYMSAQPNSYYFGNLKDLHRVNKNAIYSAEDVLTLLEKTVKTNYETRKIN